jgi:chromatin remodeling complex protein RSC6
LDRSLTYGEATTQKELPAKAYLWELAQPAEIGARPKNGKLNLWTLPDAFANKVALAEARARRSIRKHVVDRKRAAASRRARADRIAREQWPDVVVKPSAMLAAIVGSRARTRSDLLDRVWSYVGARKLYSKDSRRILPDPRVAAILGARAVSVNALSEALTDYVDTLKPVR